MKKTWYQANDFQSFQEEWKIVKKLVNKLGETAVENTGATTCRGLEHLLSKKRFSERLGRQRLALELVLNVQRKQYLQGTRRQEIIAYQYRNVSTYCTAAAHKRAQAYWEEDHWQQSKSTLHQVESTPKPSKDTRGTFGRRLAYFRSLLFPLI
jgi:hypothetical protein